MKSGLVSTTPFPHWVICMPKRPDRAKQHWYAQTRVLSDSVHVCMMRSDTRVLSDSVHVYVMRSDTVTVCINKITLGVCPPPSPPPLPLPRKMLNALRSVLRPSWEGNSLQTATKPSNASGENDFK